MDGTDAWITIAEAAVVLRLSERQTWRYTAGDQPQIRKKRQGRQVFLHRRDVAALARDLEHARAPQPRPEPPPPPPPPDLSLLLPPLDDQPDPLTVGELITLPEAAYYAGIAPAALRNYALRGRLRARRLGTQWVTTRAAVDEYLASRRRGDSDQMWGASES